MIEPADFGACGRLFAYALTSDDTGAVTFEFELPVDGDVERTYELPSADIVAQVVIGDQVSDLFCTDDVTDHRVNETYEVVSGTVHIALIGQGLSATFDNLATNGGAEIRLDKMVTDIGPGGG